MHHKADRLLLCQMPVRRTHEATQPIDPVKRVEHDEGPPPGRVLRRFAEPPRARHAPRDVLQFVHAGGLGAGVGRRRGRRIGLVVAVQGSFGGLEVEAGPDVRFYSLRDGARVRWCGGVVGREDVDDGPGEVVGRDFLPPVEVADAAVGVCRDFAGRLDPEIEVAAGVLLLLV